MIPGNNPERIFCRSLSGKDLFYIQLTFDEELDIILFDTSLRYDLQSDEKAEMIIRQIIDLNVSEFDRLYAIDKLFIYIQCIPNIKQFYFEDILLNNNGRFMEYYDNVLNDLIIEKVFVDYTVFSKRINSYYFEYARPNIQKEIRAENRLYADKYHFEDLIRYNSELESEYVEYFSLKAEFFIINISGSRRYDLYVMAINFYVVLFFIRESP